jgi:hypothetical protein
MFSRIEPPESAVDCMGKPGKGMPVTGMKGRYHPVERVTTYGVDMNVLNHVHIIIPHKTILEGGKVHKDGERKKQKD